MPREHEIPRAAQRVDVAADLGSLAVAGLFGGHVVDRPHRRPGPRDRRIGVVVQHSREPQIGKLDHSVATDQHVAGLDVAVDDSHFVGVLERLRDLPHDFDRPLERHIPPLRDQLGDVGSLDVFQGDVRKPVGILGFEHGDDVLMPESGGGLGFGLKPFYENGVLRFIERQDLQGAQPSQRRIERQVDRAHAPGADLLLDFVLADFLDRNGACLGIPVGRLRRRLWRTFRAGI